MTKIDGKKKANRNLEMQLSSDSAGEEDVEYKPTKSEEEASESENQETSGEESNDDEDESSQSAKGTNTKEGKKKKTNRSPMKRTNSEKSAEKSDPPSKKKKTETKKKPQEETKEETKEQKQKEVGEGDDEIKGADVKGKKGSKAYPDYNDDECDEDLSSNDKSMIVNKKIKISTGCHVQSTTITSGETKLGYDYGAIVITRKIKDNKAFAFNLPISLLPALVQALTIIRKANVKFLGEDKDKPKN